MPRTVFCVFYIVLAYSASTVLAQHPQPLPGTPTEALQRASEPLQKAYRSGNFKDQASGYETQKQLARKYLPLFRIERLSPAELLSLATLYTHAEQYDGAEKTLLAYLNLPGAGEKLRARKNLLQAYLDQKKYGEARPVAEALLGEPEYDSTLIMRVQALIHELRKSDPAQAIVLAERMLPNLFKYADTKLDSPLDVASILQSAFENGLIYRQMGDDSKTEAYFSSFLSRFKSSPLASHKQLGHIVESSVIRARAVGTAAPVIEGSEFLGISKTSLSDLKGKVVLLDFFAHWCPQCIDDIPYTNMLQEKYASKGLVILGITEYYGFVGGQEKVDAKTELLKLVELRKQHEMKYGVIVGPRTNRTPYGISGVPAACLIDRTGKVRYLKQGSSYKEDIEKLIEDTVNEK
jgi:thiol-disulfide isomerase/thioredoxin